MVDEKRENKGVWIAQLVPRKSFCLELAGIRRGLKNSGEMQGEAICLGESRLRRDQDGIESISKTIKWTP